MVQWINVLRNNCFIIPTQSPLLCEKTRALAIVEPGLTAAGCQVDETTYWNVSKFKLCIFDF